MHLYSDYRENSGSYSLLCTVLCPPQALLVNVRHAPGRYPFMISIVFVYFASGMHTIRLLAAIVKNLLRLLWKRTSRDLSSIFGKRLCLQPIPQRWRLPPILQGPLILRQLCLSPLHLLPSHLSLLRKPPQVPSRRLPLHLRCLFPKAKKQA